MSVYDNYKDPEKEDVEYRDWPRYFARRVAVERVRRGITIDDINKATCVHWETIEAWLYPLREELPNVSQVMQIADLLNADIGYLLGMHDNG